jgi:sulfofructosephosphate aldolase
MSSVSVLSPSATAAVSLSAIARVSGGLALLAVDQREALRIMLRQARGGQPVTDADLRFFKAAATRVLTPYASAVLVDREFCLPGVVDNGDVADGCALMVSADQFHPGNGVPVDRVSIDELVSASEMRDLGAKAMKLLVLWRSDESPDERRAMVDDFVERCHGAGLLAIIEPVVRPAPSHDGFDKELAILAAADELGQCGADLYKGEMPLCGRGSDDQLYAACQELDARIAMPWVILSSGVSPDNFPNAVRQAVRAGAIGFLAGRAVWSPALEMPNLINALHDLAAPRLARLAQIVDDALATR